MATYDMTGRIVSTAGIMMLKRLLLIWHALMRAWVPLLGGMPGSFDWPLGTKRLAQALQLRSAATREPSET